MYTSVNFELAQFLKEKGFDQKLTDNGYNLNGEESFDYAIDRINGVGVAAPTIAEVVMWLYEKHAVWISVIDVSPYQTLWEYQISKKEVGLIHSSGQYPAKYNNSPSAAYESAIEYVLTEIV